MDITNNIENVEKNQTGGDELSASSSDYDVSETVSDVNDKYIDIKDVDELLKDPSFNKLTNDEKSIVINKFNERTRQELGKISKSSDSVVTKECYFYCKNCGYYEVIPDKMFIFSRGDEKKDDIYNINFINNIMINALHIKTLK
jgi:hypothetical protein